jgi:hypothetical protein
MAMVTAPPCYTTEWQRTRPDHVVYLPSSPSAPDAYNDHLLVTQSPRGALIAIWTQGSYEGAADLRVVCARSVDEGTSWSSPQVIAGPTDGLGRVAWAGFPLVSASGRIYCCYNKNVGVTDGGYYFTGVLRCAYSDDDGITWEQGNVDLPYRRTRFDNPAPGVPCKCVVWQVPIPGPGGSRIVGFTRWSSVAAFPPPRDGYHLDSSSEVLRFDGIDRGPHPRDFQMTWLPEDGYPIRVACPIEPERSRGYSLCEEPSVVALPDGRLFMVTRTVTGRIWYTVSSDEGRSWAPPDVLRDRDGGVELLHPKAPCPLYALVDGRFLLLLHNHDGFEHGGRGPGDMNARRPVFVVVGEYRAGALQPLWFSRPKEMCDTEGVAAGPALRPWLPMYASLTERDGRRILWYPDRKHFLLGRLITDAWLAGMNVPWPARASAA